MPTVFTAEIHIPELADLANAIRGFTGRAANIPAAPAIETPQPIAPPASASVAPAIPPAYTYPPTPPAAPIAGPAPATPAAPVATAPAVPYAAQPTAPAAEAYGAPAVTPPQAPVAPAAPAAPVAAAPTFSQDEIARAAGALADAGKRQEVCDLITRTFGVQALQQIPKDQYGAFATALRGLGGRI